MSPRPTYRFATETTSRRFDSISSAFGHAPHDDEFVEVQGELGVEVRGAAQFLLGEQSGFDAPREVHLLGCGQQRDPAYLAQVLPEQIGGRARPTVRRGPFALRGHRLDQLKYLGLFVLFVHGFGLCGFRGLAHVHGHGQDPGLHGGDLQGSEDGGTALQCGVRHTTATRGVRTLSASGA